MRCDHPVRLIRHDRRGVEITGPWGTEGCDRLVLAVPVALLGGQHDLALVITPGLPRSHAWALARIDTGIVEKVLPRYPERWWPQRQAATCDGSTLPCRRGPNGPTSPTGWAGSGGLLFRPGQDADMRLVAVKAFSEIVKLTYEPRYAEDGQ